MSKKISVRYYNHPNWEGSIIVEDNDAEHATVLSMLSDDDDPAKLKYKVGKMSEEEFNDLPEWDG